jgi:hypothetical protein
MLPASYIARITRAMLKVLGKLHPDGSAKGLSQWWL